MRGYRKLEVDGRTWWWRFGSMVDIRNEDRKGHKVSLPDLTDWDWNSIERGIYKKYFSIRPSLIVDYIRKNLA